jgi:hypothetical protein
MQLASSWRAGTGYLQRGLAITRPHAGVQLRILAVFALPALAAACLAAVAVGRQPALWEQVAHAVLPWVTAVLGTVVVMVAVSYEAKDRPLGLRGATVKALPWVPRYLWTNVHTTLIFWVPMAALLQLRTLQEDLAPLEGPPRAAVLVLWWVPIGLLGLFLHTRTLLAAFLAVHGDLPATLAALEAWRLSGRHFGRCLGTLLAGSLPVGLPLALAAGLLALTLTGRGLAAFTAAAPDLLWVAIQAVRPVLIPAVYVLYRDLWAPELERRRLEGAPPIPPVARALLRITRPLPHPGRLSPL